MTALSLLLWIALGFALQLALFLGISFWQHWQRYAVLKMGATEPVAAPAPDRASPTVDARATWNGFRTFRVARRVIEDGTQSICSFHLEPEDGQALPDFLPGQFLTFHLDVPSAAGDSEALVRCYSLSDAPHRDHFRVSIKRVPAPAGTPHPPGRSSNFFHDRVQVGTRLEVRAPSGHFHIDGSDAPVVLVAGGIGITPLLSMLNWSLARQPGREIWLFYSVRNGREAIMKDHLDALAAAHPNFHLWRCFSDPLPEDQAGRDYRHRGRIDLALFRAQLPLRPYHFYICGPTPMMETLVPALQDWGVPDARIHFEAFGPASIPRRDAASTAAPEAPEGIVVTFARSGREIPWKAGTGSLLELAEANGVKVDSGCRAGSCGTCQTAIRAGEVAYQRTPDYDPEPGTCLLCVCAPRTSVILEA